MGKLWCGEWPRLRAPHVLPPPHHFPLALSFPSEVEQMPLLELEPFIYPDTLLEASSPDAELGSWWVLHTRPRAEKTLARRFSERGTNFYLPLYPREWRNRGRRFQSYLPLFPGYVFLRGDAAARLTALETNLVAHVIR